MTDYNDNIDEFGYLEERDELEYSVASFFEDGVWPLDYVPPSAPDRRSVGFADAISSEILADDTFFVPVGFPVHPVVRSVLPQLGVAPMDTILDGELIALADVAFSAPSSPPFPGSGVVSHARVFAFWQWGLVSRLQARPGGQLPSSGRDADHLW
jgi:hypothetical protein